MPLERIRIGIPISNHGTVRPQTMASLHALHNTNRFEFTWAIAQCSVIAEGRSFLVNNGASRRQYQVTDGFDYFLSCDADIAFTQANIEHLAVQQESIISGCYQHRVFPNRLCAGSRVLGCTDGTNCVPKELAQGHVGTVEWVGMGFCLIARRVFDLLPFPWWFNTVETWTDEEGAICAAHIGEDWGFCESAERKGIPVLLDTGCQVQHILA